MKDIQCVNLYKAYGETKVLQGFSISLQKGKSTVLMGSSGCGKTTFAKILMGLEKLDSGKIEGADGLNFGCVFQEDRLCMSLNAVSNTALVLPKGQAKKAEETLKNLGLTTKDLQKPVSELSGGQKRRVALARALVVENDVLVLDEAFKGLDEKTYVCAVNYIKKVQNKRTILLITHDENAAQAFGDVVVHMPKQA